MFIGAKDDGSGGDNWSYKSCKAPVKSSPPTNQHLVFYRPDALPVAQSTVSKHWREYCVGLILDILNVERKCRVPNFDNPVQEKTDRVFFCSTWILCSSWMLRPVEVHWSCCCKAVDCAFSNVVLLALPYSLITSSCSEIAETFYFDFSFYFIL